jgi:hypothetical protein
MLCLFTGHSARGNEDWQLGFSASATTASPHVLSVDDEARLDWPDTGSETPATEFDLVFALTKESELELYANAYGTGAEAASWGATVYFDVTKL